MKLRLILFSIGLNLVIIQSLISQPMINDISTFTNSALSSMHNPAGLIKIYDWNFGIASQYTIGSNLSLHSFGIAKRLNEIQTIGFVYLPGAVLEFIFPSALLINTGNSSLSAEFQQKIVYSSNYALSHAFKLTDKFSIGLSTQHISQEFFETSYKIQLLNSLPNISLETLRYKSSFLSSKISLLYEASKKFMFAFTVENLPIKLSSRFPERLKNFEIDDRYRVRGSLGFNLGKFKSRIETTSDSDFLVGLEFKPFEGFFLRSGVFSENVKSNFFSVGLSLRSGLFQFDITYFKNASNVWDDNKLTQDEFLSLRLRDININKFTKDRISFSISIDMSKWHEKNLRIKNIEIQNEIFPHLLGEFERKPIGFIEIENISNRILTAKIEPVSTLIDVELEPEEFQINPNEAKKTTIYVSHNFELRKITERIKTDIKFIVKSSPEIPDDSKKVKILLRTKNEWNGNVEDLKYFIEPDSKTILSLTRKIIWEKRDTLEKIEPILRKFYIAKFLFNELSKIITYVSDPSRSIDIVQYPEETLQLRAGDCDDLVVLYASMLGSVGIDFAIIDVKEMRQNYESHVYILFDSGIEKKYAQNITENEKKYVVMKNKNRLETLWIPVETTLVRENFDKAWEVGAEQFFNDFEVNLGQAKGKAKIVFIQK